MDLRAAPSILAALVLSASLSLADDAAAQHPGMGLGKTVRPVHELLAAADAAAIGTIDAVELGRIRVRDARSVLGKVPERFEIKRAPSKPPGLEPGSRVVLILAGARSPYLLVPGADEVVSIPDAAAETAWVRALRDVEAVRAQPTRLEALYAAWLAGPDEALHAAASAGLRDPDAPFRPLGSERIAWLVETAADAARPPSQRRAAEEVAASQLEGADALLVRLPLPQGENDVELLTDALRRAALLRSPEIGPALVRCLRHPDPKVRSTALRFGTLLDGDAVGQAALEQVAAGDPVEEVRQAAERLVGKRRAGANGARRAAGGR